MLFCEKRPGIYFDNLRIYTLHLHSYILERLFSLISTLLFNSLDTHANRPKLSMHILSCAKWTSVIQQCVRLIYFTFHKWSLTLTLSCYGWKRKSQLKYQSSSSIKQPSHHIPCYRRVAIAAKQTSPVNLKQWFKQQRFKVSRLFASILTLQVN